MLLQAADNVLIEVGGGSTRPTYMSARSLTAPSGATGSDFGGGPASPCACCWLLAAVQRHGWPHPAARYPAEAAGARGGDQDARHLHTADGGSRRSLAPLPQAPLLAALDGEAAGAVVNVCTGLGRRAAMGSPCASPG